jgi:o-succinylbenzoate synthase
MAELRRVPFRVALRVPVGTVTERTGELIEGPAGWGEYSPLPSWSAAEREAAQRAAIEAATTEFPVAARDLVEVNTMIPRVEPAVAAEMARASGCTTIKIKVGDPDGEARVRAVREAMPHARIRIDANASWRPIDAGIALSQMMAYDIELVEDPVASMEDMARLRKGSPILIGAEMCVRTVADARRVRQMGAADVLILKPQRIGGVRAALEAAAEAGLPTIASSALETSVGLAAVLALAAALPDAPFAHGIGTASLLATDVTDDPLIPVGGTLTPRRVEPRA